MGVGHGRDTALALSRHDDGVGIVDCKFLVVVDESIKGLVGKLFVGRNIESDITSVGNNNQLGGIDDLEKGSQGLVLVSEAVVFEASSIDGGWEVSIGTSFLKKGQGGGGIVFQRRVRLVHQDMDILSLGASELGHSCQEEADRDLHLEYFRLGLF